MAACSVCAAEHHRSHKYCASCFAAYMREWRKTHPLNEEQRKRQIARAYAGVYKRLGKLTPENCECGSPNTEMHHPDYSQPLPGDMALSSLSSGRASGCHT